MYLSNGGNPEPLDEDGDNPEPPDEEGDDTESLDEDGDNPELLDVDRKKRDLYFDTDCLDFLEKKWSLSEKVVYTSSSNFYFTKEKNKTLTPLKNSNKRGTSGAKWKRAYQAVKHNRSKDLKRANVENLIHAMAALYLLNIYYKDEEPQHMGKTMELKNFDNTIGSSLFSIGVQKLTYNAGWKIMHGDKRYVYVEKLLDNDYGKLVESIMKRQHNFLSNSTIYKNILEKNPHYAEQKIDLYTICKETNNVHLYNEVMSFTFNKEFYPLHINSSSEIVLNKNQEIYPIRNWAHPITGMPYELPIQPSTAV